jgi:hypothetical protein
MKRFLFLATVCFCLTGLSSTTNAQQISGSYIESRSADVYTGFCVANGEVNLVGDQAILGCNVDKGRWDGVRLDGLGIVAAVKANATLGDQYNDPYPAKAVLIVDGRATAEQRQALISFAKSMGGRLFENVVRVESAPINLYRNHETGHEAGHENGHSVDVTLRAGDIATIQTRAIGKHDHLCGNEETYYSPLAATVHAMPAIADVDEYRGKDLGVTWRVSGKRSAFVGNFSR